MSRTGRVRTRAADSKSGVHSLDIYNSSGTLVSHTENALNNVPVANRVSDFVGRPVTDSPFTLTSSEGTISLDGTFEYTQSGQRNVHTFNSWPEGMITLGTESSDPPPSGWFLDLVAGTNPSRPKLTPPTLAQDLIELPAMIRNVGALAKTRGKGLTGKDLANYHLAVQFGWLPLIQDLKDILSLQDAILKRVRELKKLESGGLRRRLQFGDSTTQSQTVINTYGAGGQTLTLIRNDFTKRRKWATIKWYPFMPPGVFHQTDEEYHRLATRLVWGLTPEGMVKGAWDVIPWTWLLGWFTNVGKLALVSSNTVPASHGTGCFMSSTVRTLSISKRTTGNVKDSTVITSNKQTRKSLSRVVSGSVTPGFNVPLIDTFKTAILSSLFVQRMIR